MSQRGMSRREFVRRAGAVGAAVVGMAGVGDLAVAQNAGRAKVVRVRDERATGDRAYQQELVNEMVARGMEALTGKPGAESWKTFLRPEDVVGIKINCLFGPDASTHPEVTQAVVLGCLSAGIKPENIIVWDRSDADLTRAGYEIKKDGGPLCYGTDGDYEDEPTRNGSFNGRLSRILTRKITAVVNVPILKDHDRCGLTAAMKNHYGSFDNPGKHHANNCNPYIADLSGVPAIKDKTRLIICDAIRCLAHGGPALHPEHLWEQRELLFSTDPVALDAVALRILEEHRKAVGLPTFEEERRPATYIRSAAERGVGIADLERIDVIQA